MSIRPSPLKSPVTAFTLGLAAQAPKIPTTLLVMLKLPPPTDVAVGIVYQPAPPVRAMLLDCGAAAAGPAAAAIRPRPPMAATEASWTIRRRTGVRRTA